jgi:hypothetical protein
MLQTRDCGTGTGAVINTVRMIRSSKITKGTIELSDTMKAELSVFIDMMVKSLPNQSLSDSLQRSENEIRGFLEIMKDIFGIK